MSLSPDLLADLKGTVQLIPLEDKPARVPGLDEAPLLPQPPTLDGNVPPLAQGRSL